jgi:hypothetical protein
MTRSVCAKIGFGPGGLMRFAFLALALVFVLVWFGAFVMFHIAGALVHVLLVAALILLIIHFVSGRQTA